MTDKETSNTRYRAGLCVTCGVTRHSAGRPRCNACHAQHAPNLEPGNPNPYPCQRCFQAPTRPGYVMCQPCHKELKAAK